MKVSEFNAQKIEPIKNELSALGWSINDAGHNIEFIKDSVRVFLVLKTIQIKNIPNIPLERTHWA